ncbi:MAG: citrate lyase holo-[acyl-carrier protein] synthase [Spirochaetes bacterium]|nr:citrate lyase holo-[acyl-carrier protein] synthase [Spirochaetota bacterium]
MADNLLVSDSLVHKIAAARELKSATQKKIITSFQKPIISFSLNIPGPNKNLQQYHKIYIAGYKAIMKMVNNNSWPLLFSHQKNNAAGFQLFLSINTDVKQLKIQSIKLEEKHPLGRIFDIDVLDNLGRAVSRKDVGFTSRTCLICSNNPLFCRRTNKHTLEETLTAINKITDSFFSSGELRKEVHKHG